MKAIFLVLFSLTAFVSNGQSSVRWLKSGSIKLEYSPSPLFYVFNKSTTNKAGSPGWLLVNVKYNAASKKRANNVLWLDDVTMETEVIIQGVYKSKNVTILLKGKTVFWSIPMDGKRHKAIGCIPPQVVARFARKGNKIELSKIIARVTFYNKNRKILMRIHSSSNSKVRNYFSKLKGSISSGVLTVDDIVMPRNKTPWGVINYELYDVIKPDSPR